MNDLTLISNATTIASNASSLVPKLETYMSTIPERRAANKLGYSIQTIGNARRFAETLNLNGCDLERTEELLDAFVVVAREDILKDIRKWQ